MSPEQWVRVRELFHAVSEAGPESREQILVDGSAGDEEVRMEAARLVERAGRLGRFLDEEPTGPVQVGERVLDRFEIVRLLGAGGMGEVYEARDTRLGSKRIAIKTIRPELARDERFVRKLTKELVLAREIVHQNICPIYDFFETEAGGRTLPFLTMRLLEGETLRSLLQKRGTLSAAEALPLARQICAGVEAAHRAGVIHGDLKPSNVILTQDGGTTAVITDFGLARTLEEGAAAGQTTVVLATTGYAAPEVLERGALTPAVDIYALGVLLYEIRMGHLPSPGAPMPPEKGWREAISACLKHRPEERPGGAAEVIAAIERREPSRWRRWIVPAAAVVLAVVALVAAGWRVGRWLSPLPPVRFVALLPLDTFGRTELDAVARGAADGATELLARLEQNNRQFWIVPAADMRSVQARSPADVKKTFSVNLFLAGALTHDGRNVRLSLRLWDAVSGKDLNSQTIVSPANQISRLSGVMAETMAQMLELETGPQDDSSTPGTQVAEAYREYEAGRAASTDRTLEGTDRAISHYIRATELDPKFADAHALLALEHTSRHKLARDPESLVLADRNLERARELAPLSPRVHLSAALVHSARGRSEEAIRELRRALELDPGDASIWLVLGHQYRAQGKPAETVRAYEEAIRLRPNYWNAYNWLGSYHYSRGQYGEAEKAFRFVIGAAPNRTAGYNNLGGIQAVTGRCAEAVEMFRKAIALAPSAAAFTNMGNCYFQMQRYPEAAAAMDQATQLQPKEHPFWRNLGDAYAMIPEKKARAAECYRRAAAEAEQQLSVKPRDPRLLSSLALYKAKLGDHGDTVRLLAQLDALRPGEAETLARSATAYELVGRRSEALARLEIALRKGFDIRQVRQAPEFAALRDDPAFIRIADGASAAR